MLRSNRNGKLAGMRCARGEFREEGNQTRRMGIGELVGKGRRSSGEGPWSRRSGGRRTSGRCRLPTRSAPPTHNPSEGTELRPPRPDRRTPRPAASGTRSSVIGWPASCMPEASARPSSRVYPERTGTAGKWPSFSAVAGWRGRTGPPYAMIPKSLACARISRRATREGAQGCPGYLFPSDKPILAARSAPADSTSFSGRQKEP